MKNTTVSWLRQQCSDNLLTEKWLLCANMCIGQTWKDRINLTGTPTVNLHCKTLRSIVVSLVRQQLAASGLAYLGSSAARSLTLAILSSNEVKGRLNYFGQLTHCEGLAKVLTRSIRDLRLAGIEIADLGDDKFQAPAKASDLRLLYQTFCDELTERGLADYSACLDLACQQLKDRNVDLAPDLIILVPTSLRLSSKECQFLKQLEQQVTFVRLPAISSEAVTSCTWLTDTECSFFTGFGEINEVRGVMQRILGEESDHSVRLDDSEVLYSDPAYIPLLYEFFCQASHSRNHEGADEGNSDGLPITFSQGIATIYSRPGRALRAWLRWIRSDGLQAKAVQLVREGILNRHTDSEAPGESIGYSRLASTLRRMSIGFKLSRYLPAIQSATESAEQLRREYLEARNEDDGNVAGVLNDKEPPRDFGLHALKTIYLMIKPLIEFAPKGSDSFEVILNKAKSFLHKCARCGNKFDRYARDRLLDQIDSRLALFEFSEDESVGLLGWLEELPLESHILGSGPQPGRLHASPISSGGFTGRRNLFVIGLDANRYPTFTAADPLLLDDERKALSDGLETSTQNAVRSERELFDALHRAGESGNASFFFSYSRRNLVEDREQFPSPTLLELYRTALKAPNAHLDDLLDHIGPPVSFASRREADWLFACDGELYNFLACDETAARSKLETQYEPFDAQGIARDRRTSGQFSEYDGYVPEAGPELAPTNLDRIVSSSQLETFGICPRRYFFKYGLTAYPPDEWNIDPERWLDPMPLGSLVHGLFERFLQKLTRDDCAPNLKRDRAPLLELLEEEIESYLPRYPVPNDDAFQRQKDWLIETCEIFLEKEQEYCLETGARPWVLEASIGLNEEPASLLDCREPITLALNDGKLLRLAGRIDRVDRLVQSGSEHYVIWDYKSGSPSGFSQSDPFRQGRKLQSFLYLGLLRHRLAAIGKSHSAAAGFGYFFPNSKSEGLRIQWTASELRDGDRILQDICDLIQAGVFPATTNKDDCIFCTYSSICGESELVARESIRKTLAKENRDLLGKWQRLRNLDQ